MHFVIEPLHPADPVAALQASRRGDPESSLMVPLVSTGVYSGPIALAVEFLDARPEATAPGWEDIHELSLMLPEGRACFNQPAGSARKDVGTIVGDEKGSYRARLHASGRDAAFDEVVESPVERHLVQFCQEPPSPVAVLSSESARGKSVPRFIQRWQGLPVAKAPDEPLLISRETRPGDEKPRP